MKILKLQPSISFPMLTSTGFSVESSASVTSTPVSPHESKTVEHPSLHGKECSKLKEVSSLSEIKDRPLMTNVLMSPTPPPLLTKDQSIVTGKPLSPALTPPALFTPLKDKLDVPSPSQPTPPGDQSTNSIYLKDDATTVSQPDTSLLPLGMPLSPCENDIIAKMEPSLPTFPSGSPSPSGPIPPNIKHLEEKLVSKNGTSPSPPPLPHLVPVLEENSAYVCGTPQTPAPPTPPLKQNLTFSGGSSPPPPPPPPSLPPPTPSSSPCLLPTTPGFTKNCSSISGTPQPPSPPTPPLKEKLVSKGGILPPPPPPPPPPLPEQPVKEDFSLIKKPCPPPPPPLPEMHVKEDFSLTEKPCPPPPPPLPSSQASKPTDLYAVPPSPPPPSLVSSLKDNNNLPKSVPSVPPPPVPFPKEKNMSVSPSPTPPIAPPPSKNYRRMLSSTMTSRSNSTKKLKPLHWLKISRAVQGSFWAEIEKYSYASK